MEKFNEFEDLRRLYRRISSRVKNIDKLDIIPEANSAVNRFKEIKSTYGNPKKSMSDKELREMYRDLKYIDSLKGSRVKGALSIDKNLRDFYGVLNSMSPELQKNFWSVYNQLYERTGGKIERIKYDVFDVASMEMYTGDSVEEIVSNLYKLFLPDLEGSNDSEDLDNGLRVPFS